MPQPWVLVLVRVRICGVASWAVVGAGLYVGYVWGGQAVTLGMGWAATWGVGQAVTRGVGQEGL